MSNKLNYEGWLTVKASGLQKTYGRRTSAKLSKNKPAVGRDEVAIKLSIDLPASLFLRPALEARVTVSDKDVTPASIDLEIQDNIEEILRDRTGFDIRVVQDKEWEDE